MFTKKIILGSASPRRKELIETLGMAVNVRKKEVKEQYPESLDIYKIPEYLSKLKAQPLKGTIKANEVLLTSDTVVIHKNKILGKPKDREEALHILEQLSDDMHEVISGVNLYNLNNEITFSVNTKVFFKKLLPEEIEYYVDKYQPYDKAGAYGIQEWIGMIGIRKIEGCFYNVMGLPVNKIWEVLKNNF